MFNVAFLVPGDSRSGGVRVTTIMGNALIARGHQVRILYPRRREKLWRKAQRLTDRGRSPRQQRLGWLSTFKGVCVPYSDINLMRFLEGEIVISVGTYMVGDLISLRSPVVKVRYNHGFPSVWLPEYKAAWSGNIPTITVASTLVPRLQQLTGGAVWGVVPNGIDRTEYFCEPGVKKDGIGAVFSRHPNKAPEDLISILRRAHRTWPNVPQRVFGSERKPCSLLHAKYRRYPTVAEARRMYNRSAIWILPSRTEGLPGVALEAMASGCTLISSDNDGSKELIRHLDNGVMVPVGDRQAFIQAIRMVLGDPTLQKRLVAGALETAQEFSWERAVNRMEEFLSEAPAFSRKVLVRG